MYVLKMGKNQGSPGERLVAFIIQAMARLKPRLIGSTSRQKIFDRNFKVELPCL